MTQLLMQELAAMNIATQIDAQKRRLHLFS